MEQQPGSIGIEEPIKRHELTAPYDWFELDFK